MLDLEPIKERLTAATPGPWFADDDGGVSTEPHAYTMTSTPVVDTEGCGMGNPKDATFIANAPTDITALVAEVERLEKEVGTERSKQNAWMDLYHVTAKRNKQLTEAIEADSDVMFARREEIEHLRAQIDAVRALHVPVDVKLYAATVKECALCPEQWPCETIRTLDVGE